MICCYFGDCDIPGADAKCTLMVLIEVLLSPCILKASDSFTLPCSEEVSSP